MKQLSLTQGKITFLDDDIYEWAKDYKWYAAKKDALFYAVRKYYHALPSKSRRNMSLHHCVIGFPITGLEVDHIDGNGLNNQRNNLRFVTPRGNSQNRREICENRKSSKYVGVYYHKVKNKWQVSIQIAGKQLHLGYFNSEDEGAKVYQKKITRVGK